MVWDKIFQDEDRSSAAYGADGAHSGAVVPGVGVGEVAPQAPFAQVEQDPLVALDAATQQGRVDVTLAREAAQGMMGVLKEFGFVVLGVHPAPTFWPDTLPRDLRVVIRYDGTQPLALVLPAGVGSQAWDFVLEGSDAPFLLVHVGAVPPTDRPMQTNLAQIAVDVPYPGRCALLGPDIAQEDWMSACLDPVAKNRDEALSILAGYGVGWSLEPGGTPSVLVAPGVHRSSPPVGVGVRDSVVGVAP
jgi:hypothetical protein